MVESDGLENRCTLTGTVGSNPTLSAMSIWDFGFGNADLEIRNINSQIRNQSSCLRIYLLT